MSVTTKTSSVLYRVPSIFTPFTTLLAAESTRHGGISPVPFTSLNLGINTTDDSANVDENRRRLFTAIGANPDRFVSSHQIHGTDVLYATEPGRFNGYDALVTNQPGLILGVTVADCTPILLYDHKNRAVAAIHAGWRGTAGKLVTKTLDTMNRRFGTLAKHCYAYVGTCIDACSFEVGPEVADQFAPEFTRTHATSNKSLVDLKAANRHLLTAFGIPQSHIDVSPYSTVLNNDDYFSYRAEQGQTGRMLAVIGISD